MDILATIQQEQDQFSQADARIAEIVRTDFDFAVNASILELAQRAAVSPPTVTRFCRRVGCQSYSEFKVMLAKSTFVGSRYMNPAKQSTAPQDVAEDIVGKAQNALFQFLGNLDHEKLQLAASLIAGAEMVYAFGSGGNSSMIATEIHNRLFRLGMRVSVSTDHSLQMMIAATARPQDVVVGSSFSGRNKELVSSLSAARDAGATTIALTQADSPVAHVADVVLPIDLPEGVNIFRPTSTRYAYLALVDILACLVAYDIRPQAAANLRQIKQQLVTHRDGDDGQLLGD
ncbi:MurR/RpiR family transcriptional regulator [Rhodobacteraceae bacterium RKSG542]|uniref:MurR/RpiR family transcriptional regulator n=1 Tax=Pseudovibrio flavus TaxID=2529854 RepID=UPI0012BBB68B|nr:MurR/RpiR family transcriptional regulator [Pseudovibrio flavus]MTI17977.1 MurR/RpiR family transcriptional regulator [Pseudovibrio flavus]